MKKKEIKQFIMYGIVGVFTTLVNYIIYCLLIKQGWLIANSLAWCGAVLFAFYTNRKVVFQSNQNAKHEAFQFFIMRFFTLLIENALLFLLIQLLGFHVYISKIAVSFITVIANYGLCKFKIFNQKEGIIYE